MTINLDVIAIIIAVFGVGGLFSCIIKHGEQISALKSRQDIIWMVIKGKAMDVLKMPTHREMDDLLGELQLNTITEEGVYRLRDLLNDTYGTIIDKRDARYLAHAFAEGLMVDRLTQLEKGKRRLWEKVTGRLSVTVFP